MSRDRGNADIACVACWLFCGETGCRLQFACFVTRLDGRPEECCAVLRSFTDLCSQCDTDTCIHSGPEWAGALAG